MGRHDRAELPVGYPIQCQKCYDEAQTALRGTARVHAPRKALRYRRLKRHMCPECKNEVVIYEENGVAMIKCLGCVPEGVACDLCRPPESLGTTSQ
ncbi:MAG: hypothetical protein AMXMBFR13_27810 [Phycisphaerae bacterium]